jgi:hypothetical protein
MNEEIVEILKEKAICFVDGTPRPNRVEVYERVQKLINLHPDDPVWVEGVARTAFHPNRQNTSFIDVAQEKGIVDDDYVPIDEECYETLRDRWDDTVYESFPRKKVEAVFDEPDDREKMKFFNDDSECW